MGIGKLSNKVSSDDISRVRDIRNPPEHEPGFEPGGADDFSKLFSGGGVSFDDLMSSDFGASPFGGGGGNQGNAGNIFGTQGLEGFGAPGIEGFGESGLNAFGAQGAVTKPVEYKPDNYDKMIESSGEALLSIGKIMIEIFKSVKNRNADDFAYYSRNLIIIGAVSIVGSILLSVLGHTLDLRFFTIGGLSGQLIGSGIVTLGAGLIGMGFAAIQVANNHGNNTGGIDSLQDISDMNGSNSTDIYEEDIADSLFNDLFGADDTDDDNDGYINEDNKNNNVYSANLDNTCNNTDYSKKLNEVYENQHLARQSLFNTFKNFFPINTLNFADKKELRVDSSDFQTIEAICLKALANVAKCEMEEVNSRLESVNESYFSYEIRLKRVKGVTKLEDIAREMEAYFRESSSDTSVNATVDIEGDFYKIIVTKGVKAVVTFGDIFKQQYVCDYFLDTNNKLPFIVGISELGEVVVEDAKLYDTMLIAGKPRSGKSWYVLSVIMSLMAFNTPEEAQFIIVDPKESYLFKTLALMPHVCGIHNDSNILDVMRDIIETEGTRRKKLLSANRCDDIWALWKKGIKLPVLYLVIDEVITIKNNLGSLDKEFDELMQTMISQLPSQGIRLLFVPHRATGVVNKTNRTMISFSAAVRSNVDDVKDTLGVQKWKRSLVNQGDVAIKLSNREDALYVRGAAITTSDEDNAELIINIARALYKMGVDLPCMSEMSVAINRDEEFIRQEISTGNSRVQYNATNIFDDLDD